MFFNAIKFWYVSNSFLVRFQCVFGVGSTRFESIFHTFSTKVRKHDKVYVERIHFKAKRHLFFVLSFHAKIFSRARNSRFLDPSHAPASYGQSIVGDPEDMALGKSF